MHAPRGGGAVWDSGTFLPYGDPRVLLPTKTSRSFNQFSGSAPCLLSGGVQVAFTRFLVSLLFHARLSRVSCGCI
jgi:hypothetical protein